jgi:hypothetical protein
METKKGPNYLIPYYRRDRMHCGKKREGYIIKTEVERRSKYS